MQDKIFKVKIFEVTHKSVKSMKVFSLEIFRLYGIGLLRSLLLFLKEPCLLGFDSADRL